MQAHKTPLQQIMRNKVTATAQHTLATSDREKQRDGENTKARAEHTSASSDHEKESKNDSTTHKCKKRS